MCFQDIQPDGELPVTLGRRQPAIPRLGSGWSIHQTAMIRAGNIAATQRYTAPRDIMSRMVG